VTKLLRRDATALGPAGTMGPFELVFLDPPYGKGLGEQALRAARTGGWLAPDATIILEDGRDVPLVLPGGFTQDDRRDYGAATVHFLRAN
jgi:16S rRNA (guanine966-N2)-methyltransferase